MRLHIGTLYKVEGEGNFFSEVARINLSKPGSTKFQTLKQKGNDVQKELRLCDVWIGSDIQVRVDAYGEPLQAIDAVDFVEALRIDCEASKKEYEGELPYRRFDIALAFLEVFIKRFKDETPVVVMYGY